MKLIARPFRVSLLRKLRLMLLFLACAAAALGQGRYVFPTEVAPLTHTTWGQGFPYNKLCPTNQRDTLTTQAYAGCGPLVMSQAMRRYNYPPASQSLGSVYEWEQMFDTPSDTVTARQENAVARLIADCGTAAHTDYGATASSTKITDVVTALKKYFGYSPYMAIAERANYAGEEGSRRWKALIYGELLGGRPVILRAERNERDAHVFIIDGCRDSLLHVNWGWGGRRNGYYDPDSLDGYRLNQRMVVGVAPQGQYVPSVRKVSLPAPGRLAKALSEGERRTLRHLKVSGAINRADLALLRQMAGGKPVEGAWKGNLCTLDLSEAVILTLPDSAFYGCESLTFVNLPLTLPHIGASAFQGCGRLNQVNIHSLVSSIGMRAFSACFCLTGITLPYGVKTIEANAFNSCNSLTEVVLPPSVVAVGNGAFANCANLKRLSVPRTVRQMGASVAKGTLVTDIRKF